MAHRKVAARTWVSEVEDPLLLIPISANLPRGSDHEVREAANVLFTGMQIHEIESQPGSTSVGDGAEPGRARCDDLRRDASLKGIDLVVASTSGLETSAANRQLAPFEDAEAAPPEALTVTPRNTL